MNSMVRAFRRILSSVTGRAEDEPARQDHASSSTAASVNGEDEGEYIDLLRDTLTSTPAPSPVRR